MPLECTGVLRLCSATDLRQHSTADLRQRSLQHHDDGVVSPLGCHHSGRDRHGSYRQWMLELLQILLTVATAVHREQQFQQPCNSAFFFNPVP
jgi:hypothetical protein